MGTRSKLKRVGEIVVSLLPVSLYCLDIACGVPGGGGGEDGGEQTQANDLLASGTYAAECHLDPPLSSALGNAGESWKTEIVVDSAGKTFVRTDTGYDDDTCTGSVSVKLVMATQYDLAHPKSGEAYLTATLFPYDTKLTPLTADGAALLEDAVDCGSPVELGKATPIVAENCQADYDFASGHYLYGVVDVDGDDLRVGSDFVRDGETVLRTLSSVPYLRRGTP